MGFDWPRGWFLSLFFCFCVFVFDLGAISGSAPIGTFFLTVFFVLVWISFSFARLGHFDFVFFLFHFVQRVFSNWQFLGNLLGF